MGAFYLPSMGLQIDKSINETELPYQVSPFLNSYSPRLFGAPPQLTHLNDMRLMSTNSKREQPGPVGDFYLNNILRNAQVANFVVGHAYFTGGLNSFPEIIDHAISYASCINKYNIFDQSGAAAQGSVTTAELSEAASVETYKTAVGDSSSSSSSSSDSDAGFKTAKDLGLTDLDDNEIVADLDEESKSLISKIVGTVCQVGSELHAGLSASLLTSFSVQQPFYRFESDWYSYINNVKMMINTAVIMLGLQGACVREGDTYYPIGMNVNYTDENDVWSNYRFITPREHLGDVPHWNQLLGDTDQYVSFMIDPTGVSESFNNEVGPSQIYSAALNQGSDLGVEVAFLTNSSANSIDDKLIDLTKGAINAAENVLSTMTAGIGRFTSAILGGMSKSYLGDHTIYPKIFKEHSSTSSVDIKFHLEASRGDPYSFLTEVWVPYSFALCMAIPALSKNNASAYTFPPLVQVSIPGMWGTRLGIVETVTVQRNSEGTNMSTHGFPLSMDVTMKVTALENVLVTSGMHQKSVFLNNHTMFDYIAQTCGVDKYRLNGAMRLVSRLALAASANRNLFHNLGDGLKTDWFGFLNRFSGNEKY